jgi:hypothetical protein
MLATLAMEFRGRKIVGEDGRRQEERESEFF